MVDVCHDGRWGRISEGSGEDPYLGSRIAEAMVHGYQGADLSDAATMMACVKHFALYGAVEAGREYNNVYPDTYHMFNEYMQPYKAAIDAGAGSIMAAFNTVQGIPATGNRWLLTDLLRDLDNMVGILAQSKKLNFVRLLRKQFINSVIKTELSF